MRPQALHVSDFLVDPSVHDAMTHLWQEVAREAFRLGHASLSTEFFGSEDVQRELKIAGLVKREPSPVYAATSVASPSMLLGTNWYLTRADLDV